MKTQEDKTLKKQRAICKTLNLVPDYIRVKKILVPTDFSEESKKALKYAALFARQFGASIVLLHVAEPLEYMHLADTDYAPLNTLDTHPDSYYQALRELQLLAKEVTDFHLLATALVRRGTPYREIVAVAKTLGIDLMIVSTHGYTGLKHALLGSTAEKVVRYAPCPVLVVRKCEHEFGE